ncbi:MAG: hypothetical protein ACYC64_17425 [Armatimonadota bacterium]
MTSDPVKPFIVYSLYSPAFPAALFGKAPFWQTNDSRTLPGSALIISAGVYKNDNNDVLAIPCGFMSSGAEQFVEEIVSRIVEPDDFVQLVIDKRYTEKLAEQLTQQEIQFFETREAVMVFARGTSMSNIRWLQGVFGGAETYVIASQFGDSQLEQEIAHEAQSGTDPSGAKWVMNRYWHTFVENPENAMRMLGDYRIFVYPGGFDPDDIVIQMQNVEVEYLRELLCEVSNMLELPLYESPAYSSQQESALWRPDGDWQPIPDVLRRVV